MATVTDPIILDSTGQDIVTALNNLNTPRDTAAYTTSFASSDTDDASATSWTVVSPIAGGETHATLFGKLSQIAKNVRFIYKTLGNTDLSAIGDGTVTGAIVAVENSLKYSAWTLLDSGTGSGPQISGTITDYNQYDEFMVVLRKGELICGTHVFDKTYVSTEKIFCGSYYLSSSSHLLITLGVTGNSYTYGRGGGETGTGTFEIYGRKYA